ncbi:hypothetical protein [uncultured Methanobrevibacter sp.]|nr:hypothetical protein [uncultured Methanobrevibacter sp.]
MKKLKKHCFNIKFSQDLKLRDIICVRVGNGKIRDEAIHTAVDLIR